LCYVMQKFNQEKGAVGSHLERSNFVLGCIRASAHCAQPLRAHAFASYSKHVLGQPQDFASQLYQELGMLREFIFNSTLAPQSSESINFKNYLLSNLGSEFGVPGYEELQESGIVIYDNVGGYFDVERDRKRF